MNILLNKIFEIFTPVPPPLCASFSPQWIRRRIFRKIQTAYMLYGVRMNKIVFKSFHTVGLRVLVRYSCVFMYKRISTFSRFGFHQMKPYKKIIIIFLIIKHSVICGIPPPIYILNIYNIGTKKTNRPRQRVDCYDVVNTCSDDNAFYFYSPR